jgi:anti-anti-sigma regulatory factor
MFRIQKTFENTATLIYKVEGRITDENIDSWLQDIRSIGREGERQIILDFCQLWSISAKALDALFGALRDNLYLLNCPMDLRNVLHAAGETSRILE